MAPRLPAPTVPASRVPEDGDHAVASPSLAIPAADEVAVPLLDAEKLDVYQVALEFQVVAGKLVPRWERVLYDQFQRAWVALGRPPASKMPEASSGRRDEESSLWATAHREAGVKAG
jgi:hypothetical protein